MLLTLVNPAFGDDFNTLFQRGTALYNEQKYEEALDAFGQARKAMPNNPDVLNWIGFIHLQRQNYPAAMEALAQAARVAPASYDAHLNLGSAYDGLKRYADALRSFQTASRLKPALADPYYNMGNMRFKLGRFAEAISDYKRAAEIAPKDPIFHDSLGTALQAARRYEEAVVAHTTATRLSPESPSFWLNLGLAAQSLALSEKNRTAIDNAWATARKAMARTVELAPSDYTARFSYAEALYLMGRFADSIPQFEKCGQLQPKQPEPFYNAGLAYRKLSRNADAAGAFRKALALKPDYRPALESLGDVQMQQSLFEEAAATYAALTKIAPKEVEVWIRLSAALQKKEDREGAILALEEAVKCKGNPARIAAARRALGNYYYSKSDMESLARAQKEYTLSLQEAPNHAEAYNALGLIAQKQGKTEEALRNLKLAVAANPKYADAFNNLGVSFEVKGDKMQAIANYKKALQIDANHALARKNLTRLEKQP
jgi:superkiller protein 3